MKKAVNILFLIFILLLFYLTKECIILPLTISFSFYMLFNSLFSTTDIKEVVGNHHKNKEYNLRNNTFIYTIIYILLIGVILTVISYFLGTILNIEKLNIINIFMTMSLVSNLLLKIIKDYLEIIGYKKISNNIVNIFYIIVLSLLCIIGILLFKVFKLDIGISLIILYSINVFVFIILGIILYITIFKKKKMYKNIKKEKNLNILKKIIIRDKRIVIYNIIKNSYIYISIIILYYILINKYNYSYELVSKSVSDIYFYGLMIIYFIHIIIDKKLNVNYMNIKDNFNNNFNKIIKVSLNLCILLLVISKPLSVILIGFDCNILSALVPLLFFYIIYNYIIVINIKYTKEISFITVLLSGIFIKIIFELPFINTIYRMGYSLILGSTFSSVLGFTVSIIIGTIFIKQKFKTNLLGNFNNILNIIYESIIYTLLLVLCTLIIKVDTTTWLTSLLVVTFYIFVTVIFYKIKTWIIEK